MSLFADQILQAGDELTSNCRALKFQPPVHTIYNTYGYAWAGYSAYVRKFANTPKRVLFLGMNPGPWGMAQTGVPFGEVDAVKGWLGLEAVIRKPENEHPKRPIEGYACSRSEVSGRRLWGLFAELYGTAERFFQEAFVLNYCPLSFMVESGANLTPDKIRAAERLPLEEACNNHLRRVVEILQPELAVGIGGWATKCFQNLNLEGLSIGNLLHPSPASPIANREWPHRPMAQLRELGIIGC